MEDDKDLQTFFELRNKLNEASIRLKLFSQQTQLAGNKLRRSGLTAQEIDPLPEDASLYRAVGKAYLLLSKQQLMEDLEAGVKGSKEELDQLKVKREHAERQLQEGEAELRELLETNTSLAQKLAGRG